MKIRELTDIKALNQIASTDKSVLRTETVKSFGDQLQTINQENYKQYFQDLTDKINKQGAVLANKPDIRELQKFRMLISEFMSGAVKFTYKYDKESVFDNRGRQKVYANIKKIDKNLDELARTLLQDQQENLDIVGLVDDICGLVIDMFL